MAEGAEIYEDPDELGEELVALLHGLRERLHRLQFRDPDTDRGIDHIKSRMETLVKVAEGERQERIGRLLEHINWWERMANVLLERVGDVERGIFTFTELREQVQTLTETEFAP